MSKSVQNDFSLVTRYNISVMKIREFSGANLNFSLFYHHFVANVKTK